MEISELSLPAHSRRVSYEIGEDGKVLVLRNEPQQKDSLLTSLGGKWEGCKIELGQLNSIQLSRNSRFQDILKDNPFVSIHAPPPRPDLRRKTKCNCKKSKCLKLYCDCFSNGLFCSKDCECANCANLEINSKRLEALREDATIKRPEGKGCKCTKSNCQKKYCDCYNRGNKCGVNCACENCENGAPERS